MKQQVALCHITFSSAGIVNRVESLKFIEQSPGTGASEADSPKWIVKLQIWLCWVWEGDLLATVNYQNFRNLISIGEGELQTLLPPRFNLLFPLSHLMYTWLKAVYSVPLELRNNVNHFNCVLLGQLLENVSIKQSSLRHDQTSINRSGSSVTVWKCFLKPSC